MGLFRKETAIVQGCAGCAILGGVVMAILGVFMFLEPSESSTRSDSIAGFAFGAITCGFGVCFALKRPDFSGLLRR